MADIYAPYTRYRPTGELRIHKVSKNGGSVEAAICSIDHILEDERGKEMHQATAVAERSQELSDLFSGRPFGQISEAEFLEEEAKTIGLLQSVRLDPTKVLNEQKQLMAGWLLQASRGKDSLDRSNWLITTQALVAARRRALLRRQGIEGPIVDKFLAIRDALEFERSFCRGIYAEVAEELRIMPQITVFQNPDKPAQKYDVYMTAAKLNHLIFLLGLPHVRPYRVAARKAVIPMLTAVRDMLVQGQRKEAVESELLGKAKWLLSQILEKHQEIYPAPVAT